MDLRGTIWIIDKPLYGKERIGILILLERYGLRVQEELMNGLLLSDKWPYIRRSAVKWCDISASGVPPDGHSECTKVRYEDVIKELTKSVKDDK